ncbi:MAG TPA: DUF6515 family protein [Chitinispirillaceae bacterium]|nr:DUF6515 family protein [Chitinispirillaceae bacterium]
MKNNLFVTITAGTTAIMLISASVSNSFGEDHRKGPHRVESRVENHNGNRCNNQPAKVYTYRSNHNNQSYQNHPSHDQRIMHRGKEYIYRDNCFYHKDHGGKLIVATAPIGAVVVSLPRVFHTVTIGNASLFFSSGIYYKRCHSGYEVVERPHFYRPPEHARRVIVREREYFVHNNIYYCKEGPEYVVCEPPEQVVVQQNSPSDVTIMVENSNGSRTPVTLNPIGGNQWKGPRGEIYNGIPDNQQLANAYGF